MPVALLVGGLVAAVGLLRLGWISEFLSTPAVTGVLAGISVQIVVHQLPAVLGVPGGGTTTVGRVRPSPASSAPCTPPPRSSPSRSCWWSCSRSGRTTAFLGRCWGVVGSIVCVPVFGLRQHGENVLGTVRGGLPSLGVHGASWADLGHLIAPALTVAFVCVVQTAVVERRGAHSAPAHDLDRDLVVIGASSAVAGLCGAFAVNASPPRTEVTRASGGRTQVTGLAAAAVFIVVLVATAVLDNLPQATLGGILVVVASRLFRPRELLAVLRFDRLEFAIALIALAVVAVSASSRGSWSRCSFRSPSGPACRPGPATPCWDASQGPTEGPHRYRPRDRTGARHPRLSALRPALVRQRCLRALAVPQPAGGEPAAGARVRSGRERHVRR